MAFSFLFVVDMRACVSACFHPSIYPSISHTRLFPRARAHGEQDREKNIQNMIETKQTNRIWAREKKAAAVRPNRLSTSRGQQRAVTDEQLKLLTRNSRESFKLRPRGEVRWGWSGLTRLGSARLGSCRGHQRGCGRAQPVKVDAAAAARADISLVFGTCRTERPQRRSPGRGESMEVEQVTDQITDRLT